VDAGVVLDKVPMTGTALRYMISGVLSRITLSPHHSRKSSFMSERSLQRQGVIFVSTARSGFSPPAVPWKNDDGFLEGVHVGVPTVHKDSLVIQGC